MSASRLGPAQEMLRKMSPSAVHPQRKRRTCVCRIWHRADTAQACHGFLADADCSCITIQKRGRDLKMRSLYDISVSTVSAKVFLDPELGTLNVYSNMWTCYPFTAALNFSSSFLFFFFFFSFLLLGTRVTACAMRLTPRRQSWRWQTCRR